MRDCHPLCVEPRMQTCGCGFGRFRARTGSELIERPPMTAMCTATMSGQEREEVCDRSMWRCLSGLETIEEVELTILRVSKKRRREELGMARRSKDMSCNGPESVVVVQ